MNDPRWALLISLALHGAALCLIYTLNHTPASPYRPVVIDLTRLEARGPVQSSSPASAPRDQAPRVGAKSGRQAPSTRVPMRRPVADHAPVERYGSVPVPVRRSEIIPAQSVKPSQTGEGLPGGGNAGSGTGNAGSEGNRNDGRSGHGISITAEQERKQYLAEHFTYIRDIIEKNLSYPPRAQRMGWAGTVVVSLSIRTDGRIRDIRIAKSSGYDILDDNVVETIRKVEPFPRPPVPVELKIPLSYQLE